MVNPEPPAPQPAEVSFEDVLIGLEKSIPRWKDPIMASVMISMYLPRDLKYVGFLENDENKDKDVTMVLRVFRLIEKCEGGRYRASTVGKRFLAWLIERKKLTPLDGAEFVMKYGTRFGRAIMFDTVFIPNRVQEDL